MSIIGRKLVLHTVAFPEHSTEEDKFVLVEVVETRPVKCCWRPEETAEGWKAIGEDGRSYYCCWDSFPDDSMSPRWMWYCDEEPWHDVCQGIFADIPSKPKFVDKYSEVLYYCDKHRRLDYKERVLAGSTYDCFYCYLKHPPKKVEDEHWKGWF